MHYPGSRGHDAEIVKGPLGPFQKRIPFPVSFVLDFHVPSESVAACEIVDLNGVVYDQVYGNYGVYERRVSPFFLDHRPHGGKVDHAGNSREVLQYHPRGVVGNLPGLGIRGIPLGEGLDVPLRNGLSVKVPEHVLKQYSYRKRKSGNRYAVARFKFLKGIYPVGLVPDREVGENPQIIS